MRSISKLSLSFITTAFLIFSPMFMLEVAASSSKNTKGKIQDNVYSAKDGSFSVRIPHDTSSSEYRSMEIRENYSREEAYVSFGLAGSDRTLYRINVNRKLTPYSRSLNIFSMKDLFFGQYANVVSAKYGCQLKEVSQSTVSLNQSKAHMCEFIEYKPSVMTLQGKTTQETVRHVVYLIDNNNYIAIVSYAQPSGDSEKFSSNAMQFIESFVLSNK